MGFQDNVPYFELKSVSKAFKMPLTNPFKPRQTVQALSSVDLVIPRKKITCLLGPNGAGKTTLIKILASLIIPDRGEIICNGEPYEKNGKAMLGKIGLVTPNERAFYWRLSGRENLNFFGSLNGYRGSGLTKRVDEVLAETDMADAALKPYRLYSAGMKQKLNIARTLLGNPDIYLLDEPAAHLDPLAREEFQEFILKVLVERRGATVFLCTHDLEEARALADEIVVLHRGKIVAQGDHLALQKRMQARRELTIAYAGNIPAGWDADKRLETHAERPGKIKVLFDPGAVSQDAIISSFVSAGGRLMEAYGSGDSLLELIKKLAGKDA